MSTFRPYLSRLRISRSPQVCALAQLLNPDHEGKRMDAHHRLLWTAFSSDPQAKRDFLWRANGQGEFIVLSARTPLDSPFFEPAQTREFAPVLQEGDRLSFVLRANATRTMETGRTSSSGKTHKAHIDLVMDALRATPGGHRAPVRMAVAQAAAEQWLQRQGQQHGFALHEVTVQDYGVHALPGWTGQRKGQPQFGVLDLSGTLTVTAPDALLKKIVHGFGRAKAFGCGLMLIRRG